MTKRSDDDRDSSPCEGAGTLPSAPSRPSAPLAAAALFGDRLELAERYAAHLADTGTSHGLIGPREVPRLWERHILNCAVIAEAIPAEADIIDVGSGAGLPGVCLAIVRPEQHVTLVEPMQRRIEWLEAVCADLALSNVTVTRARAEDIHGRLHADVVTARAVAALDKLARWCLPLVRPGGRLVAMKGSSAATEIADADRTLRTLGAVRTQVLHCGAGLLATPSTVVVVDTAPEGSAQRAARGGTSRGRETRSNASARRRSSPPRPRG